MKQTVEAGKTLLVNGPASVKILTGKAEVFGYQIKENQHAIVRESKRLPFHILEKTEFHFSFGHNAAIQEVEGSTVPASWDIPIQTVLNLQKKPRIIMIVGKADSGKSSFSTYLTNRLVNEKYKVAILDGDLGQSDIGSPCTVSYAVTAKPITALYELKMHNAFFVGVTSPVQATARTIEGFVLMQKEILEIPDIDYILVNTDGWVDGEAAVGYKLQLINYLKPDLVIGIQNQDGLKPLLSSIITVPTRTVESSVSVSERNPEKRTRIRELNYAKYLKDAKIHSLFTSYIEIQEKNVISKEPGKEKGLLIGLKTSKKKFLGIGILVDYNRQKKIMKVLTPVNVKPGTIIIGKIRLDPELHEIPL